MIAKLRSTVITIAALAFVGALSFSTTAAAAQTITLTSPTHQEVDGKFIDDSLATDFAPTGTLGAPIFTLTPGPHIWVIDPVVVEEATAMSKGYSLVNGSAPAGQDIAQQWLDRLKTVTASGVTYAMAYGNPSEYWIDRLSPHEKSYVLSVAQSRLELLLGHPVLQASQYQSNNNFYLKDGDIDNVANDSKIFEITSAYIDPTLIDTYRLDLVKVLNPSLTPTVREYLINDLTESASSQIQMIHLSTGKFTVTSSHQKLPITLTNNFPTPVSVVVHLDPTNARVSVPTSIPEKLPAKSKVQILLPIEVYSSGNSALNVSIEDVAGHSFGTPQLYPLKLSVISPVATWITTGAAILLFIAAAIQSIRRIRGTTSRKNEAL